MRLTSAIDEVDIVNVEERHLAIMKKIVLIDDDATTNYLNKIVVERSKLVDKLFVFDSAREALSFFEANEQDVQGSLILLDINMPIMNGWEFLKSYGKSNNPGENKVVLLTSSIDPADKSKAESNPFVVDYKSKPLSNKLLEELVDAHFN